MGLCIFAFTFISSLSCFYPFPFLMFFKSCVHFKCPTVWTWSTSHRCPNESGCSYARLFVEDQRGSCSRRCNERMCVNTCINISLVMAQGSCPSSDVIYRLFLCHSWQNGTRCRDGVDVLWCRSHLVWLVFEASIPIHALVFVWKILFLLFFSFIVL